MPLATARTTPREAPTAKTATRRQPADNGHDTEPWPVLDAAAYHGLAGEVVRTIAPQTEADPVALLLQLPGLLRQRDRPRAVLPGRQRQALHQPVRHAGR